MVSWSRRALPALGFSARSMGTTARAHPARTNLANAKRVVIKVGTAVVSNSQGFLALSRMGALVEQIKELKKEGREVILVSSGAVGLGRRRLGLDKELVADPTNVVDRQACAAAGQEELMSTYNMMLGAVGLRGAQVLITQNDFLAPQNYEFLTATLQRLSGAGVVPIINENDVVTGGMQLDAHAHKCFSDNDMLSALVSAGAQADAVAMMTDVDAVFTKPPDQPGAERISVYDQDREVEIGTKSTMGRGGMASKINAAQVAANGGVICCIANGFDINNVSRVFQGQDIGTVFPAKERPTRLQHWLAHAANPSGAVVVKEAALEKMLHDKAASLALCSMDISAVKGEFDSNQAVEVQDDQGNTYGMCLMNNGALELEQLMNDKTPRNVVSPSNMWKLAADAPQANAAQAGL